MGANLCISEDPQNSLDHEVYTDQTRPRIIRATSSTYDDPDLLEKYDGGTMVFANVYDLGPSFQMTNDAFYGTLGIMGAFHVGIEVYSAEWSFGTMGVYSVPPRSNSSHIYRQSIPLGVTAIRPTQWVAKVHELMQIWGEGEYHPFYRNCINFSDTLIDELNVKKLPEFTRRLPEMGASALQTIETTADQLISLGERVSSFVGQNAEYFPRYQCIARSSMISDGSMDRIVVNADDAKYPVAVKPVPSSQGDSSQSAEACVPEPVSPIENLVHPISIIDNTLDGYLLEIPQQDEDGEKESSLATTISLPGAMRHGLGQRISVESQERNQEYQRLSVRSVEGLDSHGLEKVKHQVNAAVLSFAKDEDAKSAVPGCIRVSTLTDFEDRRKGYPFPAPPPYISAEEMSPGIDDRPLPGMEGTKSGDFGAYNVLTEY